LVAQLNFIETKGFLLSRQRGRETRNDEADGNDARNYQRPNGLLRYKHGANPRSSSDWSTQDAPPPIARHFHSAVKVS